MRLRPLLSILVMLGGFSAFLFWLHGEGRISLAGIAVLILGGLIFVGLGTVLYRRLWDLDED